MDLFEAIRRRHSYRGTFKPDPVPEADLWKIAEAGVRAPSGCNKQTTHFCVINDPEQLRAIARLMPRPVVQTAQAIIAVVTDNTPAYGDTSFEPQDYGAAVENMLLAITALGYATVWLDGALRHDGVAERIADILSLQDREHFTVSVILPIGIPTEVLPQHDRLPLGERITFNTMS
ncbi:MAG TPA: nitroreductase family protein [Candidatus Limiplasma sp.]|nr:nitroreductase family protein [Candidatus Limiplasma sp.]HRX08727.1 nitroreductase family protein [Candidatus Limiplasma sp.]